MENGAYDLEGVIWHQHSNKLMAAMLDMWDDKTIPIVDLGCGHNFYASVFCYAGYKAIGVDAVWLGHDKTRFVEADVTRKEFRLYAPGAPFNSYSKVNVLSLEVGEHIPAALADGYLDNVCSWGGDVLLSWALPGQAGVGHINCRTNAWVIEEMKKREYTIDFNITHGLRQVVGDCHCNWLKHTLMYFRPASVFRPT